MADTVALTREPNASGLFMDFDGTLAEIVPEPAEAGPVAGAAEVLGELAKGWGVVALVSGRTAAELAGWFGDALEIWGLYGAERSVSGESVLAERAAPYASVMKEVTEEARKRVQETGIEGLLVEDKGVMVGLHWRRSPDAELAGRTMMQIADDLTEHYGLASAPGKMALELRPPVEWSKGDVVRTRVAEEGLRAAAFVGDDYGDLSAFDALDELAADGVAVLRVGVASPEMPEELRRRADLTLDGPVEVVRWLRGLLRA